MCSRWKERKYFKQAIMWKSVFSLIQMALIVIQMAL